MHMCSNRGFGERLVAASRSLVAVSSVRKSSAPDRDASGASVWGGTALAVSSATSVQFGAALAVTLFPMVGPVGTVSLRFLGAALVLVALTRPWRVRWTGHDARTVLVFGVVFVTMNVSLYVAVSRLPLATAITLEFLGPLAVAVVTATSWGPRAWALPAAAGVALIGGSLRADDVVGVVAALAAAASWASYILVSRRMGTSEHGLAGLALATVLGAVITLPAGILVAGRDLLEPRTLLLGLSVGVVSSALPYSLDLLALRRLPTAVFGVLTSLNPAVAALAGLVVLHELPPDRQLVGIVLVVLASAAVTLTGARLPAPLTPEATPGGPHRPTGEPPPAGPPPRDAGRPPRSPRRGPGAQPAPGPRAAAGPGSRAGSTSLGPPASPHPGPDEPPRTRAGRPGRP
jgi:inner membrane transporter RhtA